MHGPCAAATRPVHLCVSATRMARTRTHRHDTSRCLYHSDVSRAVKQPTRTECCTRAPEAPPRLRAVVLRLRRLSEVRRTPDRAAGAAVRPAATGSGRAGPRCRPATLTSRTRRPAAVAVSRPPAAGIRPREVLVSLEPCGREVFARNLPTPAVNRRGLARREALLGCKFGKPAASVLAGARRHR